MIGPGPEPRLSRATSAALSVASLAVGVVLGASIVSLGSAAATPAPTHTVEVEVPAAVETGTCRDVAFALHNMIIGTADEMDLDVYLEALDPSYQRCINP